MLLCKYCNKECKNKISLSAHQRWCPLNINRVYKNGNAGKKGSNQYTYGAIMSDKTKEKLALASSKQVWDENRKKKHSESMKKAVEKYPESYTSSNRGRTKQFIVDGVKFQGKWELEFYKYCKFNNIQIERSNEWFEYEWKGTRKYFPDFYLKEKDLYIEIKGYETDRDKAKWSKFPKKLKIIRKEDIIAIRKGVWGLD